MGLSHNRSIIVTTLLVFGMWACHVTSRTLNEENMLQRHEQWMARYGRVYKDDSEKEARFKIFKNNVAYIEAFNNAGNCAYKLSVNQFADQTNQEFKATRNGFKFPSTPRSGQTTPRSGQTTPFRYETVTAVPSSVDWRKKGAVTPVKDQGQCAKNSEAENGTCNTKKEGVAAAKITGHEDVPANSESALLKAVAMQPVSVAIDAGESDFQFYSSGVFNGTCAKEGLCGIAMMASYPTA
ncbi:hypothetical protein L1987_55302 [Smallanthus sonchifolius]|uniref:Uncharacterized protein n=1 Tax=Smallanthus sonchifolius TaxID=185202 RepID=A0ACB9EAM4_9ASTR|nr:hypothetical protein L1987_55302 [Smallanthus sonchifolius]